MGITDLLAELRKRHPTAVEENVKLIAFKGTKVGFDVSIFAYTYMYAARDETLKHQDNLQQDPNPRLVRSAWLELYFLLVMAFIECGITLVPVFDGPPFRLKNSTKEERVATTKERESKICELRFKLLEQPDNDLIRDDLVKQLRSHITFTHEDWEALEEMLRTMGLPVIKGKYEAEAVCARLQRQGLVTAVVTNDGDCLAHQGGIMISKVKRIGRKSNPQHTCTVIILQNVLVELKMSAASFVDFCILLGSDYADRMKGCGFVAALKALRSEGSVEGVVELWKKKGKVPGDHRMVDPYIVNEIRGYFLAPLEDCIPSFPLVVCYEGGLGACFDKHFQSWTRDKMKEKVPEFVQMLENFNQLFASTQKFLLESKEDV